MDLNKEREAFEKLQLGNGVTQLHKDEEGNYQSASLDYCWHIWVKSAETKIAEINDLKRKLNEAKSQAVPDGFVLVEKEKLYEVIDMIIDAKYKSMNGDEQQTFKNIDDVQSCFESLIKSQEPAHD